MLGYLKDVATVYTIPKTDRVKSPFLAILYLGLIVLVWCVFLWSLQLDLRKIYQASCPVHGVVISKVKGFASSRYLDDLEVDKPEPYQITWDPQDLIYPVHGGEGETGSFTIVTNLIITPNQTLGLCAGSSKCERDEDCESGYWTPGSNGVFTGKCLGTTGTCEIHGWCPPEKRKLPRKGVKPLLEDVANFTLMLKNSVQFSDCGDSYHGRNIPKNVDKDFLKTCRFDNKRDVICPIFKVGDITKWSGVQFNDVAVKGGLFEIQIKWDCDFDFGRTVDDCQPTYTFSRLDQKQEALSQGWNFRSAKFYSENRRTLYKNYGLKILITLVGEGRKFNFFQLVITVGALLGLFSVASISCNFLLEIINTLTKSRKGKHDVSDASASQVELDRSANTSTTSINNEIFKQIYE